MGQDDEENMTNWLGRNLGVALTTVVLAATVIASWAVAQYQILELRSQQIVIEQRQRDSTDAIIEIRSDVRWIRSAMDKAR